MTRDASVAVPCVWKLPDLWTQRTRPQVFATPPTVSHSSHTPHHRVPSEARRKPEPPESLISDPQILRRRPNTEGLVTRQGTHEALACRHGCRWSLDRRRPRSGGASPYSESSRLFPSLLSLRRGRCSRL